MLDYNQAKKLIDYASKADSFTLVQDFMRDTFEVPVGPQSVGTYTEALEKHAQLLNGKDPATLERLLSFMTKRSLSNSPLKNKLTPEQQKSLQVASLLSTILSDTHRASDLQKLSGPTLLEMIRKGEASYPDVDAALEKVGKFEILDWLGDKLAADDLKKPVESLLQKILAESDDRKAQPSNDVIDEVQPLKWKKAPHGEAQPQNLPMNPDAKSPDAPMEGLPVKSMLGKILSTTANPEALIRQWFAEHLQAQPTAELIDAILIDLNKNSSPSDWNEDDVFISCRRVVCQELGLGGASTSMLSKVLAELPALEMEAEPATGEHDPDNLEALKEAFNRFVSEEMAEGDEHDQESLEALKDSFAKFLDEEMKED